MRYDMAIIGTGPAGISAALTAAVRRLNFLLIGSGKLSEKISRAERIENYPGLPSVSGEAMAAVFRQQLTDAGVAVTEGRVNAVYPMGDYFALQAGEAVIEADTVVLATGIVTDRPLPGEDAFLGRGVSICATCDGALYRGRRIAVVGAGKEAAAEADYLAGIAGEVLYFPVSGPEPDRRDNLTIIREKPEIIEGRLKADTLVTDRQRYDVDGIFVLRDAVRPERLVPGLVTDGPHVKTDLTMGTSVPGLFACGDITGRPYQYIKAAGQGNTAALSAVAYLAARKHRQ